jgi:hypothetical protein
LRYAIVLWGLLPSPSSAADNALALMLTSGNTAHLCQFSTGMLLGMESVREAHPCQFSTGMLLGRAPVPMLALGMESVREAHACATRSGQGRTAGQCFRSRQLFLLNTICKYSAPLHLASAVYPLALVHPIRFDGHSRRLFGNRAKHSAPAPVQAQSDSPACPLALLFCDSYPNSPSTSSLNTWFTSWR